MYISEFMSKIPANRLGNLFAEYVNESEHSDWEGYTAQEVKALYAMFDDLIRYYDNNGDPSRYDEPGYSGAGRYFTKKD